ncbi:MAG TPA: sulfite exporter TauE/SafE family protein [Candidatus Avisuccinivibrio pullicola]|nr:sulfite exporter TauE/SafE family protein [Candidatus Avisuccinivibrio pullicola]
MRPEYIGVGVIFFGAMIINAITGFAGNLLAMPGTIQLIGMQDAKIIATLIGNYNSLLILALTFRKINFKEVRRMTLFILPGMVIGIWLYYVLDMDFLLYVYGAVIVGVAVKTFIGGRKRVRMGFFMTFMIMTCAGMMQSLFVSGGAFVVVYALYRFEDKEEFRATLTALWVIINTLLLMEEGMAGEINADNFLLSLYVGAPTLLAVLIGHKLHQKISGRAFFRLANFLLLLSGLSCFFKVS